MAQESFQVSKLGQQYNCLLPFSVDSLSFINWSLLSWKPFFCMWGFFFSLFLVLGIRRVNLVTVTIWFVGVWWYLLWVAQNIALILVAIIARWRGFCPLANVSFRDTKFDTNGSTLTVQRERLISVELSVSERNIHQWTKTSPSCNYGDQNKGNVLGYSQRISPNSNKSVP